MHPFLFHIGSFGLPAYGFMVACGYLAAMYYILHKAKAAALSKEALSNLLFYAILGGMLGAKTFYAFTYWSSFAATFTGRLLYLLRTFQYGFVFYGGLIGGAAAFIVTSRAEKISWPRAADVFAPAIALGHAFGRIGCFLAGCCHGGPTSCALAVTFSDPASEVNPLYLGVPVHPVQLYEAAGNLVIFVILNKALARALGKGSRPGAVFCLYAALYSVQRFSLEFLRGDDRGAATLGLSPAQLISAVIFAAAAAGFAALRHNNEKR